MTKLKKYRNILTKGITMIVLSFALFACMEDKGNYEYREINSLEISGIESKYDIVLGTRLQITPVLNFSINENDPCKYEWHVMETVSGASTYQSKEVISTERNLDFVVGGAITTSGLHKVMYCVTNLTTEIRYDFKFDLNVSKQDNLPGYIMLCERENNSFDIELISFLKDTLIQSHNLLDVFDSALPRTDRTPLDFLCYGDFLSPRFGDTYPDENQKIGKKYAIWILTDKGTDRVRTENFEWLPEFNISSLSVISDTYTQGESLIAEKMLSLSSHVQTGSGPACNYIYFKGNWYWTNLPGRFYFYMTPINITQGTSKPYSVEPFMCANEGAVNASSGVRTSIFFNKDENRFEYHTMYAPATTPSSGVLFSKTFPVALTEAEKLPFDWANPDYRPIYMDSRNTSEGFAVVKNVSTAGYEFLTIKTNATTPSKIGKTDLPAFPGGVTMENIKFFVYHNSSPYLFCATEDKVFRINVNATPTWIDVTSDIVPAGHKISKLKNSAVRFNGTGGPGVNKIIAATYDPSGEKGKNGQLALYDVDNTTGALSLANGQVSLKENGEYNTGLKWSGFGKIINVDYRQP